MPLDPNKFKAALAHTENQAGTIMMQKSCGACHQHFNTVKGWEKRCQLCRDADAPHTKLVHNPNIAPF